MSSPRQDLNLRPELYKSPALPLSYRGVADQRIELRPIGYEPIVLPLHSSALFEVLGLQLG